MPSPLYNTHGNGAFSSVDQVAQQQPHALHNDWLAYSSAYRHRVLQISQNRFEQRCHQHRCAEAALRWKHCAATHSNMNLRMTSSRRIDVGWLWQGMVIQAHGVPACGAVLACSATVHSNSSLVLISCCEHRTRADMAVQALWDWCRWERCALLFSYLFVPNG